MHNLLYLKIRRSCNQTRSAQNVNPSTQQSGFLAVNVDNGMVVIRMDALTPKSNSNLKQQVNSN
jgi:hypothetical protein